MSNLESFLELQPRFSVFWTPAFESGVVSEQDAVQTSAEEMTAPTENETLHLIHAQAHNKQTAEPRTWAQTLERIVWRHAFLILFFHVGAASSIIFYCFGLNSVPLKWETIAWIFVFGYASSFGVTAGTHRLWTHRTYKANLFLRIILMLLHCAAGMNRIFHWVRDHRVHHKFTETDADPHNATRGFFFSHVGWLMAKRHPENLVQARKIDMTDILADPVVVFNKKHAELLQLIFCFVIPTAIPVVFWEETILNAVLTQCFIRYVLVLNGIWNVNSVAHLWGDRPYNRFINPADNLFVSVFSSGEGSHNYHHTFPWDYKTSELPYLNFNLTTLFIDAMAKLGWAWDRRVASPELVVKVIQRIGHQSQVSKAH